MGRFWLCWCGCETVGRSPDEKRFTVSSNRRDGRIMVPFLRSKRKFRVKSMPGPPYVVALFRYGAGLPKQPRIMEPRSRFPLCASAQRPRDAEADLHASVDACPPAYWRRDTHSADDYPHDLRCQDDLLRPQPPNYQHP